MSPYVSDPLQPSSKGVSGKKERTLDDVSLNEWGYQKPIGWFNWYKVPSQPIDLTQNIIDGELTTVGPIYWKSNNQFNNGQHPQPKLYSATPPAAAAFASQPSSLASTSFKSTSSPSFSSDSSSPSLSSINEIVWNNQRWVNDNAQSVHPSCGYWGREVKQALVIDIPRQYSNNYWTQIYNWSYSQLFPPYGLEMRVNKPYPVYNGTRLNESSLTNWYPELDYNFMYWNQAKLPQRFFTMMNDSWGNVQCDNLMPPLGSSQDLPSLIHGMDNSFLLTRMQSIYTNRTDGGIPVTFSRYWDQRASDPFQPGWIIGNNTCPNPKLNTRFVTFPEVTYEPLLSSFGMSFALGALVFLALLHMPASVAHIIHERENQLLHMMRISGMTDTSYWIANWLWEATVLFFWFAVMLSVGFGFGSVVFTQTSMVLFAGVCIAFIHYIICFGWLLAAIFSQRRVVLVVCYLLVVVSSFVAIMLDQYLGITWSVGYLVIPPVAFIKAISTIIRYMPGVLNNDHDAQLLTCVLIMLFEGTAMGILAVYLHIVRYRPALWFLTPSCKPSRKVDVNSIELEQSFNAQASNALLAHNAAFEEEDVDCAAERARVEQLVKGTPDTYPALLLHNLRKEFGDKVAVNKLSMTVEYGTCVGLLGPNGAGVNKKQIQHMYDIVIIE